MRARPFIPPDTSRRPFGLEAKRHKYNVAPAHERTVDGMVFDSKAEAKRYSELKLLQTRGFIRGLELQPQFRYAIDGKHVFTYHADFAYFEGEGRVIEDVKGVRTEVYKLKKKIIEAVYHLRITEVA